MSDSSRIEWTDSTWNPIIGCTRVSEGCQHCYAVRMAHRLGSNPETPQYKGLTFMGANGPEWSGEVRCLPDGLEKPFHWRKPRRIFVGSMTDLFHPLVPFEFLDRIFAVMALCQRHTFQVLTKRPERMREYLSLDITLNSIGDMVAHSNHPCGGFTWPLPNVWLGVTPTKDQDIATLLQCPAVARYVSIEPMLRAWDIKDHLMPICQQCGHPVDNFNGNSTGRWCQTCPEEGIIGLDWVICGGETGPGARPMDPAWVRSLRDQCQAAGVPFFVKKMSGGGQPPEDLRIREFPNANA